MIPIVFSTDNNYVPILAVAITSLLTNAEECYLKIYVAHEGLKEENIELLQALDYSTKAEIAFIDMSVYLSSVNLHTTNRFSRSAYYRILIPKVLTQYEKIIYMDCDVICLGNIKDLYKISLEQNAVGGVMDYVMIHNFSDYLRKKMINTDAYFNSGIIVFDTILYKQSNIEKKCFQYINGDVRYAFPDQDILNLSCEGQVAYLEEGWNYQWHRFFGKFISKYRYKARLDIQDVYIVHYTSEFKPWVVLIAPFADKWWKYYKLLPKHIRQQMRGFFKRENKKFVCTMKERIKRKIQRGLR